MLREYHAALGDLIDRFEGTLERFTGDGLMVFFNDPLPCDDAAAAGRPDGGGDARAGAELADGWRRQGHDLGFGDRASPRATRRSAGSASRAASTTPRSAASPTWPRGCAPRPALADPRHPARARRRPRTSSSASRSATSTLRGFSRPVRAFEVPGLDAARASHDAPWTRRTAPRRSPTSTRPSATRASTGCRSGMPDVWAGDAAQPRGRVRRRHPVGHHRPGRGAQRHARPRPTRSASCSCCCCCASRGCG